MKAIKELLNLSLNIPFLKYEFEIERMGSKKSLIVDLGCGDGSYLRSLKPKFPHHEYIGVDTILSKDEMVDGVRLISGDLFDFVKTEKFRSSRMVILNDVIEHLSQDDIVRLLTIFEENLAESTVVFCQFPNCSSPFGWRNQSGDPTHVTVLSALKFDRLASQAKLSCQYEILGVEEIASLGNPVISYATGLLYYKILCKFLGYLLFHSIGWNKHFWTPNLLVKIII